MDKRSTELTPKRIYTAKAKVHRACVQGLHAFLVVALQARQVLVADASVVEKRLSIVDGLFLLC